MMEAMNSPIQSSSLGEMLSAESARSPKGAPGEFEQILQQKELVESPLMETLVQAPLEGASDQSVMTEFLGQMQQQLGLNPEEIVEAMIQLSPEQLMTSAKDNVTAIAEQLPLNSQQKVQFEKQLSDLLNVIENNEDHSVEPMAQALAVAPWMQTQVPVQSAMQQRLQVETPSSLPRGQEPAQTPSLASTASPTAVQKPIQPSTQEGLLALMAATVPRHEVKAVGGKKQQVDQAVDFENSNAGIELPLELRAETHFPVQPSQLINPNFDSAERNTPIDGQRAHPSTAQVTALGMPQNSELQLPKLKADISSKSGEARGETGEVSHPQHFASLGAQATPLAAAADSTTVVSSMPRPAATPENIHEVIQQAQFMAQKGGGEMKIQLQPEGLGEIAMKVRVADGQVSVEMITEGVEAKSAIESSLADLKASLVAHHLNVDSIKVDVAREFSANYDHQREQGQRQMQQQFMDQSGGRSYRPPPDELMQNSARGYRSAPIERATYIRPPTRMAAGTRRLDLVA